MGYSGLRVVRGLLTIFIVLAAVAVSTAFAQTTQISLPEQSLSQSLKDLARQSGSNILFTPDSVKGIRAPELHGELTVADALAKLLAATGLEAVPDGNGGSIVRRKVDQSDTGEQNSEKRPKDELAEIVVTGTYIRGADPLSPLIVVTGAEMVSQGYTRLDQFLEQLPQNFTAGVSSASNPSNGVGEGASNNYGYASGVNLRGLGPDATLVLLNGRRLAPTAFGGTTDISGIPLSAIERVEILTDGASATYGTDAVAGVVNIITKRDFSGLETGARLGTIAKGKTADPGGYFLAGTDWTGGGALLDFDYEKDNGLDVSKRSFSDTALSPAILLPYLSKSSLTASAHQTLSDRFDISSDVLWSSRKYSTAQLSPFNLALNDGTTNQIQANGELDYRAGHDWKLALVGTFSHETDHNNINYVGSETSFNRLAYGVSSIDLRGDGPIIELPGGTVRGAAGLAGRRETYASVESDTFVGSSASSLTLDQTRTIGSAYGEVLIPIVDKANSIPGINSLMFDAAARFDHYSNIGSSSNPKFSLKWGLTNALTLRASYSRSFRAPSLYELDPNAIKVGYVVDEANPASPTGTSRVLVLDGTNADLKPETSITKLVGLTITPPAIPNLKADASFFYTNFQNRIIRLDASTQLNAFDVYPMASQVGKFLNNNPTLAQIEGLLNDPGRSTFDTTNGFCLVGSPGCAVDPTSVNAILAAGFENAASSNVKGVDLSLAYKLVIGPHQLRFDGSAAYINKFDVRFAPAAPPTSGVGVVYQPSKIRSKINVGWTLGPWNADARVNYTDGELNPFDPICPAPSAGCKVSSWTTMDLAFAFDSQNAGGPLRGLRIGVNIANVFNRLPPYAFNATGINYDPVNASPLQRYFSVTLTKRW